MDNFDPAMPHDETMPFAPSNESLKSYYFGLKTIAIVAAASAAGGFFIGTLFMNSFGEVIGICEIFFCTYQWSNEQQLSTKHLFYFANIENSIGTYIPNSLRNNESISNLLDGVNIEIRTYEKLRDVQKSSIVNSCRMRISMKKNLQDSSMIISRVMIEFDDLLSVLNDTQLKSALNTYKEITELMKRSSLEDAIVKLPTPTLSSLSEVDIESNVHDISDTNVIIDILSTSVPILVSKMKIEKLITNKNLDLSEQKQSKFEGNIQCGLEIIARCSRDSFISSSVNMSDNSNKTSSQ
ncbi:unnamed protein product [Rotaria sp. Silwood1]|nr:unnamed protein product [Rotaria sp. Silwood1]